MCFVLNETGFFGRYTLYIVESIFQAFSELKIAEKVNTKIMKRNRYHKLGHTTIFRGVISMMLAMSMIKVFRKWHITKNRNTYPRFGEVTYSIREAVSFFPKTKSHNPVSFTGYSDLTVFHNHQIIRPININKKSHEAKNSHICDSQE